MTHRFEQPSLFGLRSTAEPAWRIAIDGGPLLMHDPRCWLDPRHHAKTPCSWPADRERAAP